MNVSSLSSSTRGSSSAPIPRLRFSRVVRSPDFWRKKKNFHLAFFPLLAFENPEILKNVPVKLHSVRKEKGNEREIDAGGIAPARPCCVTQSSFLRLKNGKSRVVFFPVFCSFKKLNVNNLRVQNKDSRFSFILDYCIVFTWLFVLCNCVRGVTCASLQPCSKDPTTLLLVAEQPRAFGDFCHTRLFS